jgi:hypothetical protein
MLVLVQNPKLMVVREKLIRKNREYKKTEEELKRITVSHAEKRKELEVCQEKKADVEERLNQAESESQTSVQPLSYLLCACSFMLMYIGCSFGLELMQFASPPKPCSGRSALLVLARLAAEMMA